MIRFACPSCNAVAMAPDEKGGKVATCPSCQARYTIPKAEPTVPPAVPPVTLTPVFVPPPAQPPPAPPRISDLETADAKGRPEKEDRKRGRKTDSYDFEDDDDEDDKPRRKKQSPRQSPIRRTGSVTLARIDVVSSMKIQGAVCFVFGLIIALFYGCMFAMAGATAKEAGLGLSGGFYSMGAAFVLIMPVMYGIAGAIGGLIFGIVYNICASMVGGLVLEFE